MFKVYTGYCGTSEIEHSLSHFKHLKEAEEAACI